MEVTLRFTGGGDSTGDGDSTPGLVAGTEPPLGRKDRLPGLDEFELRWDPTTGETKARGDRHATVDTRLMRLARIKGYVRAPTAAEVKEDEMDLETGVARVRGRC